MSLDPKALARRKFQAAIAGKKATDDKAAAVIWAAVVTNAGLGAVPLGINIWTFIGVNTAMITFLGGIYGYHLSNEGAGKLIRQIFVSVGTTFFMLTLGLKFFAEVLKGAGIITMGGATAAGMALDAVLCGAVTYALGYTTKDYLKKDRKMSKEEMRSSFKSFFEEGKAKVKEKKSAA